MNKKVVIYIKASLSFFIPFGSTLGVGLEKFNDAEVSTLKIVIVLLVAFVAGGSGLGNFLSRSYADHQDDSESETTKTTEITKVSDVPSNKP